MKLFKLKLDRWDEKFPRLGFETFPMGPGFATFPNQFHFNISQMWQPSFIPKERPHQTLKLNQLKTFPSGLSRRTTTYWQSCRMTSRSFWKSLTPKMWPWGTTGGCAPATLRSQAEGCSARFRTSKRWFFYGFFTFELCSERLWLWLDQRPIRGQYVPQKLEENSESEPYLKKSVITTKAGDHYKSKYSRHKSHVWISTFNILYFRANFISTN